MYGARPDWTKSIRGIMYIDRYEVESVINGLYRDRCDDY